MKLIKSDYPISTLFAPIFSIDTDEFFKPFTELFQDFRTKTGSNIKFKEEGGFLITECDVPGIEKEDIKITFNEEEGYVSIEASNEEESNKRYYKYAFTINIKEIDTSADPKVKLHNGVLSIKFKKKEEEKDSKVKTLKVE